MATALIQHAGAERPPGTWREETLKVWPGLRAQLLGRVLHVSLELVRRTVTLTGRVRATRASGPWSVELGIRRHDMNTCRYSQVLTVYIGAERFGDVSDQG